MLFILTADLKAEYNDQSEDEKEDSDSTEELRVPSRQLARHVEGKVCTLHMVGEVMSGLHLRRQTTGMHELTPPRKFACKTRRVHPCVFGSREN